MALGARTLFRKCWSDGQKASPFWRPTISSTADCDWPVVQRVLNFYISLILTFNVNNTVQHYECLPGETVWKCANIPPCKQCLCCVNWSQFSRFHKVQCDVTNWWIAINQRYFVTPLQQLLLLLIIVFISVFEKQLWDTAVMDTLHC